MKKGYLVTSSRSGYLTGLNQWTKDLNKAHWFDNRQVATHSAESHSYFSCSDLEVTYIDIKQDISKTVYRTKTGKTYN